MHSLGLELPGSLNHDQPNDENGPFLPAARRRFPHDPENLRLFPCDRTSQPSEWMDCIVPVDLDQRMSASGLKATSPIRLLLKRKCRDETRTSRSCASLTTMRPSIPETVQTYEIMSAPGIVFNGELGYAEGSAKSHFGNV